MNSSLLCQQCQTSFSVTDDDRKFLDMLSPIIGGKKQALPEPTLCPVCRQRRRQASANQLHLHRNTCGLTGKSVISNFRPDSGYTIYSQEAWWGDGWDSLSYGRDFDFTRPFFDQYKELAEAVPYPSLTTAYQYDENSEYTNYSGKNKNCYLIFDADENRDCYYSYSINGCTDCADCYRVRRSELTVHSIDCAQCYNCAFLQDSSNCRDSMFLKNCTGCKFCIMCSNLNNKEYFVENKQVSKEEFAHIRDSLNSREAIQSASAHFDALVLQFPQKAMRGFQTENCSGDYLLTSKNAKQCFDGENLWDCRYAFQSPLPLKDSMDTEQCGEGEKMYESSNCVYNTHTVLFCNTCWPCRFELYCTFCFSCSDCFGCCGLKHKKFCILNKQYTKEEYEALVPKIIEHMRATREYGEFFPPSLALFPYNETIAYDYDPLSEKQALVLGYKWHTQDDVAEGQESSTDQCLCCETCKRSYRITAQELALLRRKNLPLPTACFLCRHRARMKKRNPRILFDRACGKCSKPIQTTYAPDRLERVYCEDCFLNEVY